MALGLIFGGCIILIYQKMKLQSNFFLIYQNNTSPENNKRFDQNNNVLYNVICQKRFFEKDGIHRIKAV